MDFAQNRHAEHTLSSEVLGAVTRLLNRIAWGSVTQQASVLYMIQIDPKWSYSIQHFKGIYLEYVVISRKKSWNIERLDKL